MSLNEFDSYKKLHLNGKLTIEYPSTSRIMLSYSYNIILLQIIKNWNGTITLTRAGYYLYKTCRIRFLRTVKWSGTAAVPFFNFQVFNTSIK